MNVQQGVPYIVCNHWFFCSKSCVSFCVGHRKLGSFRSHEAFAAFDAQMLMVFDTVLICLGRTERK